MDSDYTDVSDIMSIIATRDDGTFVEELNAEMEKLVRLCMARHNKGALQITITLKPDDRAENVFNVDHDLKVSPPKVDRPRELLFADVKGRLSLFQPKQSGLDGMEPAGRNVVPGPHQEEGNQ